MGLSMVMATKEVAVLGVSMVMAIKEVAALVVEMVMATKEVDALGVVMKEMTVVTHTNFPCKRIALPEAGCCCYLQVQHSVHVLRCVMKSLNEMLSHRCESPENCNMTKTTGNR